MTSRLASRASALAVTAALAAALAAAPTAANAETEGGCEITDGALSWGVKESFRAYISGSIANGEWKTADGATYETPDFQWTGGTGALDPETGVGSVSFTGTVHFTGHDGVLDLTLANPTIAFEGDGGAALLLDAKSTDMEGDVAVDTEQEWVGEVVTGEELAPADGTLALEEAPTTLTDSGAKAFAGFYEGGIDLDPVSLTLEMPDCAAAAEPTETAAAEPEDENEAASAAPAAAEDDDIPWLPIGLGAVALLVIGVTVGVLIGGRRPRRAAGPEERHDAGGDGQ